MFKGIISPKMKIKCSHHLLTLMSFQTCVRFFLMLNTKEDILENFEKLNSYWSPLTREVNTMEVNVDH